ncbi:MAG: MarR family transcriptional regulator [Archangiaceae bacterium]|nr:MarR family transcriptional regulator [Archangiaceae bacterium]
MQRRLERLRKRQADSLGFLLIRCGQLWNERGISQVNAEAGRPVLREAHTKLLPYLQAPTGIRITALAEHVGVTKQAVQPLVAELARQGLVRVEPDPDDARARRVALTAAGVEAMLHGTGVLERIERDVAPALGKAELEALKRSLRRLLAVLE